MSGMFGIVSNKNRAEDLFYGTDYHSLRNPCLRHAGELRIFSIWKILQHPPL